MLGLCDRFKVLPSQLYAEDADLLRLLRIEAMGRPDGDQGQDWDGGEFG